MVTVFCINYIPKFSFGSPVMPFCIKSLCSLCGQVVTWRYPVCNDAAQAATTINLFCFWPTQGFCVILHCEVIFVWNQRHPIFSFRGNTCDFCFVLNCNASFLTVLTSVSVLSVNLYVFQFLYTVLQFTPCIVVAVALDLWFTENYNVGLT